MAEKQTAATAAATPELVTITVAARRTIHVPGENEDGEKAVTVYGPGQKLQVDPAEARRLRAAGFADPEPPAASADQAEA